MTPSVNEPENNTQSSVSNLSSETTRLQKAAYYVPQGLMMLFIILSPFTQDTSIKEFCFYISATIFFVSLSLRKPWVVLKTPLTIAFLLFLVWSIAGIPMALNKPNTIHDIYGHWIKYLIIYLMLVSYFQNPGEFRRLAYLIVITGCLYAVWYVCYFYFYLGYAWSERLVMYPYRDYLFTFSSMIAIGQIQHHKPISLKLLFSAALLFILAGAILSQARNAVLAITVGSLIFMLKYRKTAICMVAVVVISVAVFPAFRERLSWNRLIRSDRISTNLITLEIIKDYPLFGIGFGMQTYGYKEFIDLEAYYHKIPEKFQVGVILGSPHNLIMDVTVRTGILGGLLFLYIYWCEIRMLFIVYRQSRSDELKRWAVVLAAAFVAFLVQSQFGDAAFSLQAIVFITILAMTSILWRRYQHTLVTV